MSFFKDMDLDKSIILISMILFPLGAWLISDTDARIALCEDSKRAATKRGGYLEEIGKLQKQIEVVAQNRRSGSIENPSAYFEPRIRAANPDLRVDDFSPRQPKADPVTIGRQKAVDQIVAIDWGRGSDRRAFPLGFVYAVLFNCESGVSHGGGTEGPPSVWRLRHLELSNVTTDKIVGRYKTPPPEIEDGWYIKQMDFARREPRVK